VIIRRSAIQPVVSQRVALEDLLLSVVLELVVAAKAVKILKVWEAGR
jgi:hypothetical protein